MDVRYKILKSNPVAGQGTIRLKGLKSCLARLRPSWDPCKEDPATPWALGHRLGALLLKRKVAGELRTRQGTGASRSKIAACMKA